MWGKGNRSLIVEKITKLERNQIEMNKIHGGLRTYDLNIGKWTTRLSNLERESTNLRSYCVENERQILNIFEIISKRYKMINREPMLDGGVRVTIEDTPLDPVEESLKNLVKEIQHLGNELGKRMPILEEEEDDEN